MGINTGDKAKSEVASADGIVAVKKNDKGQWCILAIRRGEGVLVVLEQRSNSVSDYDYCCQKAKRLAYELNERDAKHGKKWVAVAPPPFTVLI